MRDGTSPLAEPTAAARRLRDVYLCRHGQTDYNAEARLQGQRDIPLNDTGREQAKRNGAMLRERLGDDIGAYRFVASPLGRAVETMQILRREMGLAPDDFSIDARLKELSFGDWEGSTLKEIKLRDPDGHRARKADKWNFRTPGETGESYADLVRRIRPVIDATEPKTILVAHGGIARAVLNAVCGLAEDEAATIGIPQDRVLTFEDGRAIWV